MITMVTRKVYLRPTRSPSRPNTSAPNGRTAKPAAKATSAKMKPVVSLTPEKNCAEMIVGEQAVEVEVVPLEDGAERRGEDHRPLFSLVIAPGPGRASLGPRITSLPLAMSSYPGPDGSCGAHRFSDRGSGRLTTMRTFNVLPAF